MKRVLSQRERDAMEKEAIMDRAILGWFEINKICTPDQYPDVLRIAETVYEMVNGEKCKAGN